MSSELRLLDLLQESLADKYTERQREGCHVSDLTLCKREAVFRRLDPKTLSLNTMMFFITGEAMHQALQTLVRWVGKKRAKIEKKIKYKGVIGTIDLLLDNVVCEIKTVTSKNLDLKPHYKNQIECYMAMIGLNKGKVMIVSLTNFNQRFKVHDIEMVEQQIIDKRKWIEQESKQFNEALKKKDWRIVDCVKDTPMGWKCDYCAYKTPCFEYEETKKQ